MAENEVKKEKKSVSVNIWFIIFIVYLIFSLSYIFSLRTDLAKIEGESKKEIQTLQTSNYELTSKLYKVNHNLETIYELLAETKIDLSSVLASGDSEESVEISTGTYTGTTSQASGEETIEMSMSLTLAENNMATLVENDSTLEGTYTVSENTVVFSANDGSIEYSFEAVEEGSLKLVNDSLELTLTK